MSVKRQGLRAFALFMALAVTCFSAGFAARAETSAAETATVTEVATVIGENEVRYPQITGLADERAQEYINDTIVEKAKIAQRMVTLSTLQPGGTGLTVEYTVYLANDVFSTVIDACGIMENGRAGQSYTALTFDLTTGEAVTLSDLFTDPDAAVEQMETILVDTYLDDLSSYLENAEITPLPTDSFALDNDGITFYYPASQFSLLSGYCGAVQFYYDELEEYLNTDPAALPTRLNVLPAVYDDAEMKAKIEQAVEAGELPHVKAKLGDALTTLIEQYRLLRTPDQYPGGRYFQLEAPSFRQVLVLSDALTSGWENSDVEGLLCLRGNLYGLRTGVTPRDRWLAVLGAPDSTVVFDEEIAYDYGLPTGVADYYTFGGRQLMLYAWDSDVLCAIRLTE